MNRAIWYHFREDAACDCCNIQGERLIQFGGVSHVPGFENLEVEVEELESKPFLICRKCLLYAAEGYDIEITYQDQVRSESAKKNWIMERSTLEKWRK